MRALLSLLLAARLAPTSSASQPSVQWANGSDNVYARAIWKRDNPAHHLVFLGMQPGADACAAACLKHGTACRSFTFTFARPSRATYSTRAGCTASRR